MKIIKQAALLVAVCLASDALCRVLPVKLPSSVVSIVLVFVLLLSGIFKESYINETAGVLMGEMSLLFLPIGMSTYYKLVELGSTAVKLLLILSVALAFAFVTTYYVVCASIKLFGGEK